jgi:3-dehydroquinate synthase
LRGIPYVQVPTTLLAAVDSSVGGKTGIDLEAGKNLAGVFYQPSLVICDCTMLKKLPPRILSDGCAEVIKYGMIADHELFNLLDDGLVSNLEEILARCVEIKRDIVREDEFEEGLRMLLNFGHTAGHAIESLSNYSISHGKAVAIGMAIETQMAVRSKMCDIGCYNDLVNMLHKYGLPYTTRFSADDLARAALADKKRRGDKLTLVAPEGIGRCTFCEVRVSELKRAFAAGITPMGEKL